MTLFDSDPQKENSQDSAAADPDVGTSRELSLRLIHDPECRRQCVAALERADERVRLQLQSRVEALLSPLEQKLLADVDRLAFTEGSWYRVTHNRIVPLAMRRIINGEQEADDLMLAAIAHDAGYAMIAIAATTAGPDWQAPDRRQGHMDEGARYLEETLRAYRDAGELTITDERIATLRDIVATHDNPYLGEPLSTREERLHRDADRCFVMSHLSFWKDYLAYVSTDDWATSLAEWGEAPTPEALLLQRLPSFYRTSAELPANWDASVYPLTVDRAALNEGGAHESIESALAKQIVDQLFVARAHELERFYACSTVDELEAFFEQALYQDLDRFVSALETS